MKPRAAELRLPDEVPLEITNYRLERRQRHGQWDQL